MSKPTRRARHLALAITIAVGSFLVLVLVLREPGAHAAHASAEPMTTATLTDTAAVSIEPLTSTIQSGETFTVSVVITDVTNLGGFQFNMTYDPKVVHVDRARVGPFLGSTGRNIIPQPNPEIDNDAGWMSFGAASFGMQPGPDGGGTLARIVLTGQGTGHTPLDLQDTRILSPSGERKPVTVADGTAVVKEKLYVPLFLHNGG